jgi:hypothetical protein
MSALGHSRHSDPDASTSDLPPVNGLRQAGPVGPFRANSDQRIAANSQIKLVLGLFIQSVRVG